MAPEPDCSTGLLQVALQGTPHRATGTVQGSTPVLRELNGATFKQPAPLAGPVLVYRAKASEPSTLPTLAGEFPMPPPSRGGSLGGPCICPRAEPQQGGGRCCMERRGWGGSLGRGLGAWSKGLGVGERNGIVDLLRGCWGGQSPTTCWVLG